jgi:hypothetical protein
MEYTRGAVSMIPDGEHDAVICKSQPWEDKLIVEFSLEDGTLFSHFFTPGFPVFDDILTLAGVDLKEVKGEFDESKILNKIVKFTTKITKAKDNNEYCNVMSVKEVDKVEEKKEEAPAKEEEKKEDEPEFPEDEKKSEEA